MITRASKVVCLWRISGEIRINCYCRAICTPFWWRNYRDRRVYFQ